MGRAQSKRIKDFQRQQEYEEEKQRTLTDKIIRIILDYSWHDPLKIQGEIVYTVKSEEIMLKQLTAKVGHIPMWVTKDRYKDESNPRYGEVLNNKVGVTSP